MTQRQTICFCYQSNERQITRLYYTKRIHSSCTEIYGSTTVSWISLDGSESEAQSGTGVDAPAYMAVILDSFGSPGCATWSHLVVVPTTRTASNFRNAAQQDRGFHDDFPDNSHSLIIYYNSSDNPLQQVLQTMLKKILDSYKSIQIIL